MLTYSETDILIHNVSKIRKYNQGVVRDNHSALKAYCLAEEAFNYPSKAISQKILRDKFIGTLREESSLSIAIFILWV